MEVAADPDICVASGQCALLAPGTFTQRDGDGIVEVLNPEPGQDEQEAVQHAVLTCPSGALRLLES